jgi:hypothetical protein
LLDRPDPNHTPHPPRSNPQSSSFPIQRIRDKHSPRKFDFGVFTARVNSGGSEACVRRRGRSQCPVTGHARPNSVSIRPIGPRNSTRLWHWTSSSTDTVQQHHVRLWQILLKKSFEGDQRNFLGPLMRFARRDVRDHIAFQKNNHGASYPRYRALQRRSRPNINVCEISGVVRFSTFATLSAPNGHAAAVASCPLLGEERT